MREPLRILLHTTIPERTDDWHMGRFSLLHSFLQSQVDEGGNPLFAVTARDRVGSDCDPLLSRLDSSKFDELWLVAVDDGNGLTALDCEGITRFHRRGGVIANPRSSGCWIVGVQPGKRGCRIFLSD